MHHRDTILKNLNKINNVYLGLYWTLVCYFMSIYGIPLCPLHAWSNYHLAFRVYNNCLMACNQNYYTTGCFVTELPTYIMYWEYWKLEWTPKAIFCKKYYENFIQNISNMLANHFAVLSVLWFFNSIECWQQKA